MESSKFRHLFVTQVQTRTGSIMRKTFISLVTLVLYTFTVPSLVQAKQYQPHNDIKHAVKSFIETQLGDFESSQYDVIISRLDPRLKLSQCETALRAFVSPGTLLQGKTTIGVRCEGAKPWKVYVPTQINAYETVLAASRPIIKGQTIGSDDLVKVRKKVAVHEKGFFHNPKDAIGMVAKRSIPAGKILTFHYVQPPRLVQRGQDVILLATTPNFQVRMKGRALTDGAKGDVIHVRNSKSKRIVQGRVTRNGVVQVGL